MGTAAFGASGLDADLRSMSVFTLSGPNGRVGSWSSLQELNVVALRVYGSLDLMTIRFVEQRPVLSYTLNPKTLNPKTNT